GAHDHVVIELEVARRDGNSVAPAGTGVDVEGERLAVGGRLPAFREDAHRLILHGVQGDEVFIHQPDDVRRKGIVVEPHVEGLGGGPAPCVVRAAGDRVVVGDRVEVAGGVDDDVFFDPGVATGGVPGLPGAAGQDTAHRNGDKGGQRNPCGDVSGRRVHA